MPTFRVVPADLDTNIGWVVKTIHDNGIVETSVIYESQAKAETAAENWRHLDDDWAKV
jgi:hypothetical protein